MQNKKPKTMLSALRSPLIARRGQTLIETLVAVSVLTTGFLGIVTLLSQSLGLNRVAADNYTASYLAAEGVEITKNLLDANTLRGGTWPGVNSGSFEAQYDSQSLKPYVPNKKINFDSDKNLFLYDTGTPTAFTREIQIDISNTDEVQVNSIVSWTTRGGAQSSVNVEDHFFKK